MDIRDFVQGKRSHIEQERVGVEMVELADAVEVLLDLDHAIDDVTARCEADSNDVNDWIENGAFSPSDCEKQTRRESLCTMGSCDLLLWERIL